MIPDGVLGEHIKSSMVEAGVWQTWLVMLMIAIIPEAWYFILPWVIIVECWLFDEIKSYRSYRVWKTS